MIRSLRSHLGSQDASWLTPAKLLGLLVISCVLAPNVIWSSAQAQTEATWTGGAGTTSYSDPDNWDTPDVPINAGGTTYNVTIPNSVSVNYDVDGVHEVTDLTLGTGSTLTIAPGEQLDVLDDAGISGLITTAGGTFNAPGAGAQLLNNQARLITSASGEIILGALSCSLTRSDYRGNLTLLSADGQDSLIDLSSALSLISASYGHNGVRYYDVVASNHGVIDLSSAGSITGAADDDWLRLFIQGDGDIPLTALGTVSGRTQFVVDVGSYSLPALQTAANTYFTVKPARTLNVPALVSMTGGGSTINVQDTGTFNAGELLSINNTTVSIGTGATLDAAKLETFTNSTITLGANQTFNHGVITSVDYSELHVRDGVAWVLDTVESYTNTLSDYRGNLTLLSADGQDSLIDLSSALSLISASYGYSGVRYYDIVASDHGVIDLSSVGSITGAGDDDRLRLFIESGGDIPLTSLTSVSGRTQFIVDVDNYSLPALDTAANTYFTVKPGRTLNVPELVSMSGSGSGINIQDGATLNAPKLTSIAASGGPVSVGNAALLSADELVSIDNAVVSIAAAGTLDAPKLEAFTKSTITLGGDQTFTHGVIADVDYSELHVRDGATLALQGVGQYTNLLDNYRAHLTLLSAQGQDSLLDMSSAQSFSVEGSWSYYETYYYDVVASDHGVIDLSSVGTVIGATNTEWLRFRIETEGDILLPSLTQTSARTQFVVGVDNYNLPALVSAANTHFSVGAGRAVSIPELTTLSGSDSGIGISDGGSFSAAKLTSISGSGGSLTVGDGATLEVPELLSIDGKSISIAAGGTISAPKLIGLTNVSMTLGANQTFTHAVITDVDYSELHAREGATLALGGVGGYTNLLDNYRAHLTLLSAQGQDSLLDMSSAQSFSVEGSWSYYETYNYDVVATDHGVVDLSSVGTVIGATNTEWLRFVIQTEGNILLTSLAQTSARTQFVVDVDNYSLPALETAANTHFSVGAGRAVSAPELMTISGSASGIGVSDGGSFSAAKLTSISGSGGSLTVGDGATLEVPELLSIDGKSVSIAAGGTISAPKLVALTNVSMTLGADQTFTHAVITDVDYSELHAREGVTLALGGVGAYTHLLDNYRAHLTLLSAQGQDSRLDMSSAQSLSVAGSWSYYETYYYEVVASDHGVVDLSSVGTVTGATQTEWLRFRVDTGGEIDLSSLRSIADRVMFNVDGDGVLKLGDVALTQTTYFNVNHPEADVTIDGSLYLDGASQLSMASGSTVKIAGALYYAYTDAGRLAIDSGILHFDGSGIQFLEVGGEDLGADGSSSGNFGIGRLVVGELGQPTTVMPLDLFDNGNRTGGAHEALYLYGVGGMDGIELVDGSTLILDTVNVYAMVEGEMVHLNGLLGEGMSQVPFSGGTIMVPEPASLMLLALAAATLLFLYCRRCRR